MTNWAARAVRDLADDVGRGWRRIRSKPMAPLGMTLMLAAGIGVTTATTSVLDSLVVRTLPFPDADRLVGIGTTRGFTRDVLRAWRESGAFDAVEMAIPRGVHSQIWDESVVIRSALVTSNLMPLLDARPLLGGLFQAEDGQPGVTNRILISEAIWRSWFGADPGVIGRSVDVEGFPRLVAGVMPSSFRFPEHDTAIWMPVHPDDPEAPVGGVIAKLAPGVTAEDAEAVARALTDRAGLTLSPSTFRPSLRAIRPRLDARFRQAVVLLTAGATLLFVLACANAACFVLADLGRLQHRFATASALGATRDRLMRQVIGELIPVGLAMSGFGIALASVLIHLAPRLVPGSIQAGSLNPIDLDPLALAVTALLAMSAAVGAGLLPAWVGTRSNVVASMRGIREVGSPTRLFRLTGSALLVVQMAMASAVLAGAALVSRSFVRIASADVGLDSANVVAGFVLLPRTVTNPVIHRAAASAVEGALRGLPNVAAVTLSIGRPGRQPVPGPRRLSTGIGAGLGEIERRVDHLRVRPEYFRFYGIPMVAGRALTHADAPDDVVVSRRLADTLWPGEAAVGRSFRLDSTSYRVIGIAGGVRFPSLGGEPDWPEIYSAFEPLEFFNVHVRCRPSCPPISAFDMPIRDAYPVQRVDLVSLADEYAAELTQPRMMARTALVFGGLAWLTAAGGLFGVLRYAVARRRKEFGIRAALGASPGRLRSLVFGHAVRVAVAGLVIGAPLAWALARGLSAVLYDVQASDPLVWLLVAIALGLAGVVSVWRPAGEASRAAPAELARTE